MNNLLFITGHRHIEEVRLCAEFLNNTQQLKEFDLLLHINSLNSDTGSLKEKFKLIPNKNKHLILTDRNCEHYGLLQALSDFYYFFQKYDNVVHAHIDVFMVNENNFTDVINSFPDKTFLVNHSFITIRDWMSTDLFIFRPKLLKKNIFKDWVNHAGVPLGGHKVGPCCLQFDCTHVGPCPEQYLYWQIIKNNIPHEYIKRFDTDHWDPRRICMWGCYHEHDLNKVVDLLNSRQNEGSK